MLRLTASRLGCILLTDSDHLQHHIGLVAVVVARKEAFACAVATVSRILKPCALLAMSYLAKLIPI